MTGLNGQGKRSGLFDSRAMTRLDRNARLMAVGFAAMAGMVDAIGFLASGGFFLSFMSGNSTRLSVGLAAGAPYIGMVALLLLSFVAGVTGGSVIGRNGTLSDKRRQSLILGILSVLLFIAPLIAGQNMLLAALCLAAFCMGAENTLFERDGSVSFGLTYMTGANWAGPGDAHQRRRAAYVGPLSDIMARLGQWRRDRCGVVRLFWDSQPVVAIGHCGCVCANTDFSGQSPSIAVSAQETALPIRAIFFAMV